MGHSERQALQVLAAWRAVERFQAMKVPELPRSRQDRARVSYGALEEAGPIWPVQPSDGPASTAPHTLVTRVYVGTVEQAEVDNRLRELFTEEGRFAQGQIARRGQMIPIAYFDVDEQGRPLEDSLSPCPLTEFTFDLWRRTRGGPADPGALQGALRRSDMRSEQMRTAFELLLTRDSEPLDPLPLTRKVAAALLEPARHLLLGTRSAGSPWVAGTVFHGIWVRTGQEREPDLLSSFFLPDLGRASTLRARPPTLVNYLAAVAAIGSTDDAGRSRRVDVAQRVTRECVLDPVRLPRAAWPSGYPLRLSQQGAVTSILHRADSEPLMSVNGPPGTGKTTLLRDLYANLVAQRAGVLAEFDHPRRALTGSTRVYVGDAAKGIPLDLWHLDVRLTGFEMVVASSNNGAVENVSAALPSREALAERWREPASYFRTAADLLSTTWAKSPSARGTRRKVDSWGLAAAILGQRAHINVFIDGLGLFEPTSSTGTGSLRETLTEKATAEEWQQARSAFLAAGAAVEQAVQARADAAELVRRLDQLRVDERRARNRLATLTSDQQRSADASVAAAEAAADAESRLAAAERALADMAAVRPGRWARLRRAPEVAAWTSSFQLAQTRQRAASAAWDAAVARSVAAKTAVEASIAGVDEERTCLDRAAREIADAEAAVAADARRFPAMVTEAWWQRPADDVELGSAWVDPELQQLREQLFLTAMTLHEVFLRVLGQQTLRALRTWKALVTGAVRPADRSSVALLAWQWLFLVVPLVSTTFASLGRMLGDIDADRLGWLIVDEAGQATPQSAVGALLRFRRAVIVGDPDQLEPVVTLPEALVDRLTTHHGAPPQASPARCSAQLLADAANPLGTSRGGRWVGLPLRVHNRCLDPMYTIANEIAYDSSMVQGRVGDPAGTPAPLGPSRWIHVALTGRSHWSDGAEDVVRDLLASLRAVADYPESMPSVALLSPFRIVVEQLRRLREEFLASLEPLGSRWQGLADDQPADRLTAGTVHTFQGREKDAVVLVLGGASAGSRMWVAGTPNLINVAVTRARDRLYVVGDIDKWDIGHAATLLRRLR